jgi:RNA polymerase sigma-70 factor (ECF subfamily)
MAEEPIASDADLVKGARLGDAAAFDALVRRYARPAYAIALSMTGDDDDAKDICQDVFVRVIERLEECRSPDRFGAWFFTIVRSTVHNFRRRERLRRGAPIEASAAVTTDDPAQQAERSDLRGRMGAAVARLNATEGDVVMLHDLEGWTHQQIARALGISEVGSRQHLFVARRKLRESLADLQLYNQDHD